MIKVLILAFDFPPYVSVGGLRPKSWYDYMHEFDVEPIIITRQWSNKHKNELDYVESSEFSERLIEKTKKGTIIRTPYFPNFSNRLLLKYGDARFRLLRKLITAYFEFFQFVFPIGPKAEIYRAAKDYLSSNKVDCILATGDPFVLFLYASKLGKKHDVPWIADYRDLWSSILERQNKIVEKNWNSFFEKRVVPKARLITTVSNFVEIKIRDIIKKVPIEIIPNGYNYQAIHNTYGINQKSDILRILLAGSILEWNAFDRFISIFNTFCIENSDKNIELNFYGLNIKNELTNSIKNNYPLLKDRIKIFSKKQNELLLEKMAEANVLLLFNNFSFMGTKIYDYVGVKRKILLCFVDDQVGNELKEKYFPVNSIQGLSNQLQADLIAETNSGIAVKHAEHLKIVLQELSEEFKQTGQIACNSVNVENYSRKIQVQKLAELIKSIC